MKKADQAAANCGMEALPPELISAWEKTKELDQQQCPQGTPAKPLTAAERETTFKCWKKLVLMNVAPVSKDKTALSRMIDKSNDSRHKKLFADYDAGKINRDEVGTQIKKFWDEDWPQYAAKEASFYNLAQCQNKALAQHVMPVYHNKGILADFMAKRAEIALDVDKRKITPQEADVKIQKAMAVFINSEQYANAAIQARQEQAWQNYSARMQQFSTQLIQADQQGQIKNTNCQKTGNIVNCTTW